MSTDQTFLRMYSKKNLGLFDLRDRFLDALMTMVREGTQIQFRSPGIFDVAAVVEPESGGLPLMIDIARLASLRATDGTGVLYKFNAADSRLQNVKIPPSAGVVFHVGIEQSLVEDGIEINPRTGLAEYSTFRELPGKVGTPDLVTDNGTTITLQVNSITAAGDDHSGRMVRVWLKSRADGGPGPLATTAAVAIQEIGIVFSGGNNQITIPNLMGQQVASETEADYEIQLVGPTVRRLSAGTMIGTNGIVFLAAVTGVASGAIPGGNISTTAQNIIAFSESAISTVLRIDSHGDTKISVTADASDTDESQIRVVAADGATVVASIDEDGDAMFAGVLRGPASATDPVGVTGVDLGNDGSDPHSLDANVLGHLIPISGGSPRNLGNNTNRWDLCAFDVEIEGRLDAVPDHVVRLAEDANLVLEGDNTLDPVNTTGIIIASRIYSSGTKRMKLHASMAEVAWAPTPNVAYSTTSAALLATPSETNVTHWGIPMFGDDLLIAVIEIGYDANGVAGTREVRLQQVEPNGALTVLDGPINNTSTGSGLRTFVLSSPVEISNSANSGWYFVSFTTPNGDQIYGCSIIYATPYPTL